MKQNSVFGRLNEKSYIIDTVVPSVVRSWWLGWQGLVMNASCRTESINGNVHASFGRLTAEYTRSDSQFRRLPLLPNFLFETRAENKVIFFCI